MINWLLMIISFIGFWIFGFFLHEVGHVLGAYLTGGKAKIKIWIYKGIPSMKTYPEGNYNRMFFLLSGGSFTFIVYIILTFCTNDIYYTYPLYTIGIINLVYANYECAFLDRCDIDKYMRGHYLLYAVVFVLVTGYFYAIGAFA